MFQPAFGKNHQFGRVPGVISIVGPGVLRNGSGKPREPKFAAFEAGRHRGKVINAGQDADAPDLLIGVDVGLEMGAVTVASEFKFLRLDLWLDKA